MRVDLTAGETPGGAHLQRVAGLALGAVFVYQLLLLLRYQQGATLRVGLKACLKAA